MLAENGDNLHGSAASSIDGCRNALCYAIASGIHRYFAAGEQQAGISLIAGKKARHKAGLGVNLLRSTQPCLNSKNEKGPVMGPFIHFGSGGVFCPVSTARRRRVRLK